MSRRKDSTLREAIDNIEGMLLYNSPQDAILTQVLNQLMSLFNSSFGYIYQCHSAKSEEIPWALLSCLENDEKKLLIKRKNTCASTNIPHHLKRRLVSGQVIFNANEPLDPLPDYHPDIDNYCIIPLMDAFNIYAVAYVCNTLVSFDDEAESRVRPFLAAASCIIRAAKKIESSKAKIPVSKKVTIPHSIDKVIKSVFDPILIFSVDDHIVASNVLVDELLDPEGKGLINVKVEDIFPNGMPKITKAISNNILNEGRFFAETDNKNLAGKDNGLWSNIEVKKLNNEEILLDLRVFKFSHGGHHLRGIVFAGLSDNYKYFSNYHNTLQRFQALTNIVPVGILQLDRHWQCTYVNDTFCNYCHMSPSELGGDQWAQCIHPDDAAIVLPQLRSKSILMGNYSGMFKLQSPLGQIVSVQVSASALYDNAGIFDGVLLTFNDITEQLESQQRLQIMAERDQLTGLKNRAFFNERLKFAIEGVDLFGSLGLIFLDLDGFKSINDTYGHHIGDQLLQQVAERLEESVEADTIARLGGDEFTLLITNIYHTKNITQIADNLIAAFNKEFHVENHVLYVTCSVGLVFCSDSKADVKTLFRQADVALYHAKDAGKNQSKLYDKAIAFDENIYTHLNIGLKQNHGKDFYVLYQPQVDVRSNRIVGVEALTRWSTKNKNQCNPDVFIKVIEKSGLINDFSDWLFSTVLAQVQQWIEKGLFDENFSISINLSAKQFSADAEIVLAIISLASRLGLKVVAEGVDNKEVVQWLIDNQCYFHQGFYHCKPLSIDGVEKNVLHLPMNKKELIQAEPVNEH